MTTKDQHILTFWWAKLHECEIAAEKPVSAGEVARYVGQSIGTAKRYLKRLVGEGGATANSVTFPNKVEGVVYATKS